MQEESRKPDTKPEAGEEITEEEIDKTLRDSFPASDPPSWTTGTDHKIPVTNEGDEISGE